MLKKRIRRATRNSNGENIVFVDIESVATINLEGKDLYRLEEFTKTFLEGAATVCCNTKSNPIYHIHKVNYETFDRYGLKLDKGNDIYSTPLTEFELSRKLNFFAKAGSVLMDIYLTFEIDKKNGFIVHLKFNFK